MDIDISKNYPTFLNNATPNCASTDPDAFFLERGSSRWESEAARRVCASCLLIEPCREWAIEKHEFGVWGGTTELDRKRIRKARKNLKNAKDKAVS